MRVEKLFLTDRVQKILQKSLNKSNAQRLEFKAWYGNKTEIKLMTDQELEEHMQKYSKIFKTRMKFTPFKFPIQEKDCEIISDDSDRIQCHQYWNRKFKYSFVDLSENIHQRVIKFLPILFIVKYLELFIKHLAELKTFKNVCTPIF